MSRALDRVNDACAALAALLLFVIGVMITWEVVARYVFNAPTIWAEEMSRFFQVWAIYLALAWTWRERELISITVVVDRLGPRARVVADAFALLAMLAFTGVAVWYGAGIAAESVEIGRRSSTMLTVPQWMTEIAIPIGFALLGLQIFADLARLPSRWRAAGDGAGAAGES